MQNTDFWGGNENRSISCICMNFLFIFKNIYFLTPSIFLFTAIRQAIKDIEDERYDSKKKQYKVSIEQI